MASRPAPILAIIPPPAQFALTLLVGIGLDRLRPWRPAWMAIGGVHWAGLALAVAGCSLAAAAAGRFVLRRTTLHPTDEPARLVVSGAHALVVAIRWICPRLIVFVGLALALGRAWPLVLADACSPSASDGSWQCIPFEEARAAAEPSAKTHGDYRRRGPALDLKR